MPDLTTQLAGLRLKNPTLTCSGTCGYAFEYADFMDLSRLGAFVTKSITREERAGNEPARVVEVRGGMLNAIGLANVGLRRFLDEKAPMLKTMPCPVIVNVAGHSFDDYIETCAAMNGLDCIAGVELNVSCPNVKDGLTFGTHPGRLKELTTAVKKAIPNKPLIVKLSPNVEDITQTARAAIEGGADVLSMVNTFTAMAIDIYKKRPRLANVTGGLSGPAIKPIALHLVSRVYRQVAKQAGVPIIGMGGVQNWQDAVEFILAGASAVAIGTALFVDPAVPNKICEGLDQYLVRMKVDRLSDLVGALEMPGDQPAAARIRDFFEVCMNKTGRVYAAPGIRKKSRVLASIARLPLWLIAISLWGLVWLFNEYGSQKTLPFLQDGTRNHIGVFLFISVLFIPGALRRLNWRHLLLMLGFAGAWYAFAEMVGHVKFIIPFPNSEIFWAGMPVLIAGFGEWLMLHPRKRQALLWLLSFAITVGCLIPLIQKPLEFSEWSLSIPHFGELHSGSFYWPLRTVMIWIAVPAALRIAVQPRRAVGWIAAGVTVSSAAAFFLASHVIMYSLAQKSLRGGGPFTRNKAAVILDTRFNASDKEALWDAFRNADLTRNASWNWRENCINVLYRHDPSGTALRLSAMLDDKPTPTLANLSASIFAEQHRYETAPLLLRYAFHNCLKNADCTNALEKMRIPFAALPIFQEIRVLKSLSDPGESATDFAIDASDRQRLIRLLGKDAGLKVKSWESCYDQTIDALPIPLPKKEGDETRRVVMAMGSYIDARERLRSMRTEYVIQQMKNDGQEKCLKQLDAIEPALRGQSQHPYADLAEIDPDIVNTVERYEHMANVQLSVASPNWDVRGTDGLEKEVSDYAARVDMIISKFRIAQARPTSIPSRESTP